MAVPKKFLVAPNAATRELWRAVESAEYDKILAVLPSADINAPNEHGMTALMRAARQGYLQIVRVLLEHGADPNAVRNDKFTALSLAAFFGHSQVVEILMAYGASTKVETRYGTSPKMWATARSFGDVARCLEQNTKAESVLPEPVATPAPAAPVVVRTLSDPPEIWDLVHEAPRSFNASSAFLARLSSMRTISLLGIALLIVAIGLGSFAAFRRWKGLLPLNTIVRSHESTTPKPVATASNPANPATSATSTVTPPANTQTNSNPEVLNQTATTETPPYAPRRSRSFARSRSAANTTPSAGTTESAQPPPATAPAVNLPIDTQRANDGVTKNKTTAPLSPQMISPPQSSPQSSQKSSPQTSPPKAKVIQWP